jgi:hypothetical protein
MPAPVSMTAAQPLAEAQQVQHPQGQAPGISAPPASA